MEDYNNNRISLSKYSETIRKEGSVVIVQKKYGTWIKMKDYVFNHIFNHINSKSTINELLNDSKDKETKDYLDKLIKKMLHAKLIETNSYKNDIDSMLKSASISLTNKCNLNCIHCSANANESDNGELEKDQIFVVLSKIEQMGIENVSFTGGEILLRKDLFSILSMARNKLSGRIAILTNGVLINNENAIKLKNYVDEIHMSIDGYNEESCDYVRGSGVYKKVLESIKILKKINFKKISLSMVETKLTKDHKDEFFKLCSFLDVKPILRKLELEGRAVSNYSKLHKSENFIMNKKELNKDELNILKNNINSKCFCDATIKTIFINEMGNIFPCAVLSKRKEYKIGSIFDEIKIIRKDINKMITYMENFILDQVKDCNKCSSKYFCSTGCPGIDMNIFLNYDYRKERCRNYKELYNKIIWVQNENY